jgi:hypothetical protein
MMKQKKIISLVIALTLFCGDKIIAQSKKGNIKNEPCIKFNGKPFFPIGFYYYPDSFTDIDNKELDLLVKSGFNTIHIDVRDTSNCILFFDQCYKKGLKIVAQFGSKTGEHSMGDVSCLSVYKNHPVLLGWSIADDANNGHYSIDSTKMRHDSVKAARPELFTFLSVYENYEKGISFAPHEFKNR